MGEGEARGQLLGLPVDRAIRAAIAGNVTFYSIDPSGPPEPDPAKPDRANAPQAVGDFARLAAATGSGLPFGPSGFT